MCTKKQKTSAALDTLRLLQECWPLVFPVSGQQLKPWSIGILDDLMNKLNERQSNKIERRTISIALRMYQARHRYAYLTTLATDSVRYDLDGRAVGEITPGHKQWARNSLREIQKRQEAAMRKAEAEEKIRRQIAHQDRMRQQKEDAAARKAEKRKRAHHSGIKPPVVI